MIVGGVEACLQAATDNGADQAQLVSEGWSASAPSDLMPQITIFQRNDVGIVVMRPEPGCVVTARLADDSGFAELTDQLEEIFGVSADVDAKGSYLWRTADDWQVGVERASGPQGDPWVRVEIRSYQGQE